MRQFAFFQRERITVFEGAEKTNQSVDAAQRKACYYRCPAICGEL